MYKLNVILFVLIAIVLSCEKDEISYPITYSTEKVDSYSLRIYTPNGEITSEDMKYSIVQRYKYQLNALKNENLAGRIVARYLSKDTVELMFDGIKEEKSRIVHEEKGMVYWEKQDTSLVGYAGIGYGLFQNQKYFPLNGEIIQGAKGSGYNVFQKSKECFYVKKKKGVLSIPMYDFFLNKGFNGYLITEINNELSGLDNYYYSAYDTVIIQEYSIKMKVD